MDNFELLGLIAAFFGFFVAVILISLVFYILKAVALYQIASRNGVENAWLSFIPFGWQHIQGQLTGEVYVFGISTSPRVVLPLGALISIVISFIPIIGWLFSIAYTIYYYVTLHKFYKNLKPDSAVLYTVLSILILGVAEPIIFFTLRNYDPISETKDAYYEEKGFYDN